MAQAVETGDYFYNSKDVPQSFVSNNDDDDDPKWKDFENFNWIKTSATNSEIYNSYNNRYLELSSDDANREYSYVQLGDSSQSSSSHEKSDTQPVDPYFSFLSQLSLLRFKWTNLSCPCPHMKSQFISINKLKIQNLTLKSLIIMNCIREWECSSVYHNGMDVTSFRTNADEEKSFKINRASRFAAVSQFSSVLTVEWMSTNYLWQQKLWIYPSTWSVIALDDVNNI